MYKIAGICLQTFLLIYRAQNNSWICAGQGDLSTPLLAGRDQLLEGQNV